MPLSNPAPRERIHSRSVICEGFRRADGLWDVEGHITDLRHFHYSTRWKGQQTPEQPLHQMWLRLTLDDHRKILAVETSMDDTPFDMCTEVTQHYQRLIGITIGAGFGKKVGELVGGVEGCTHVTGLLHAMATVTLQAMASEAFKLFPDENVNADRWHALDRVFSDGKSGGSPSLINTCHTHAENSPVTQSLLKDRASAEEA
jgi:hypothetical protein